MLRVPVQGWLKLSTLSTLDHTADTVISGVGNQTVYIYAEENSTPDLRSANIRINNVSAGNIYQAGSWRTLPNLNVPPSNNVIPFVGAFWRANETGERIIRVNTSVGLGFYGSWKASVIWMDARWGDGDGVILSVNNVPALGNDPNNPGNAEQYQVGGDNLVVSDITDVSNGDIAFRIGLKSAYTPTSDYPARYAVALLSYADGAYNQLIYLRQGHDADYLMTSSEPSSGLASRPVTRKISPFNVTAPTLDAPVDRQDAQNPANRSDFTPFPTQAGAFFQYAIKPPNQRFAYNPYAQTAAFSSDTVNLYWDAIKAEHETCPPGYRRPNDGVTHIARPLNPDISISEIRQSLFQNPPTGTSSDITNSIWGYYADGFFDRLEITSYKVASGDRKVAYRGTLFFNPNIDSDRYNASVFFPFAGYRVTNGGLNSAGSDSRYSISTRNNAGQGGISLALNGSQSYIVSGAFIATGVLLRCVKEP
jgi:hypothetical protein